MLEYFGHTNPVFPHDLDHFKDLAPCNFCSPSVKWKSLWRNITLTQWNRKHNVASTERFKKDADSKETRLFLHGDKPNLSGKVICIGPFPELHKFKWSDLDTSWCNVKCIFIVSKKKVSVCYLCKILDSDAKSWKKGLLLFITIWPQQLGSLWPDVLRKLKLDRHAVLCPQVFSSHKDINKNHGMPTTK